MKFEITKQIKEKVTVDIDLPYYYKQYFDLHIGGAVLYGKVEESRCTSILVRESENLEFELCVENKPARDSTGYMSEEYKSNEDEYLIAKARLIASAQEA